MDKENGKSQSALREEAVLKFWKENKIFEKSLEKKAPKGDFVFYEGPPTANGKPGIHHLEARAFKDVIPRYKTMQGYYVRRKGGWDTHGLPVELQVEKELGLKSKKDIEEYGIAKFNQECKKSVWTYVDLWEKFTERIGFWVDQENPYVTYHNDYIESVWNVIKTVDNQKLLYKDYKVVPWCPRCGTTLSSHELAQGYENVKDLSVYVKFKIKNQENTFILAWTTTPWTLPGNVALAVGEKIDYVKVKDGDELIWFAKDSPIFHDRANVVETKKGADLIGLEYEPLFPQLRDWFDSSEYRKNNSPDNKNGWKVYEADFVTTDTGTGIVHIAPMFGEDDFNLAQQYNLPKWQTISQDGKFKAEFVPEFLHNKYVREKDDNGKPIIDILIIDYLKSKNLFLDQKKYEHSYPHCWRCHTALIYYARDSWYIRMSSLRDKLIKENKGINWEPDHIKEGRFGEWLREVKDWAISRERYWGTPLPVWHCDKCQKIEVVGSIEDLKKKTKKSGNKYFVMRHGETEGNLTDKICSDVDSTDGLTEKGKKQVFDSVRELKNKNISLIISSDFFRTKETAEIIKKELNISDDSFIFDKKIREINAGKYNGKKWSEYPKFFESSEDGAESLIDVRKRISDFLYEIEKKYQNKNILIVTHESAGRLMFTTDFIDFNFKSVTDYRKKFPVLKNAEVREINFVPVPHNKNYELDLHKPFIDETELVCDCGGKLERTKEVMDVWLDSGTMPFSQDHYPFENKNLKYPADFISEAIDQTRGWFYTLHAVGVLMGKGKAYKNVICLGHLLDAKGKKMSKSIGNVVDPWEMIEKYGVDTLRLWMYSVNQPGESKNFDEKTVSELHNKVFNLLYNVLAFYELYRDPSIEVGLYDKKPKNILDKWIIARLDELIENSTRQLNDYKLLEPVRATRDFIDDLSTWYLRRSRERIKEGDVEAKRTLYYVLKNLAKLMAPFAPFSAEDIWLKLRVEKNKESVHLSNWPTIEKKLFKLFSKKSNVIKEMEQVREIVTLGLQARQKAGIPVRQPLAKLSVKNYDLNLEYTELIKDEINVREVVEDKNIETEVVLDLEINSELKEEGNFRELVRAIQDMRKKIGLTPSDKVSFFIETNEEGKILIQKFEKEMKKIILAEKIEFKDNNGQEIKIDEILFKIEIKK